MCALKWNQFAGHHVSGARCRLMSKNRTDRAETQDKKINK